MKNSRGKKLSARAASELLGRTPHRIDDEMSRELLGKLYVLQDGGAVLLDVDGSGIHFFSYDQLVARYRANVKNARAHKDPIAELLPNPERFRTDVPALVAQLPELIGVDTDLLDFSEESLDAIDAAIRRLGAGRILTPQVFPSLIAYVGEVIRRHVGGAWQVQVSTEGTSIEPDIVDAIGSQYSLLRIYKQLLESGRTASMRAFVHAALTTHRLLPRH